MDKFSKMKYSKPEVIDFEWMGAVGDCDPNGSGATGNCSNGNNPASTCLAGFAADAPCFVGSLPIGGGCVVGGDFAV